MAVCKKNNELVNLVNYGWDDPSTSGTTTSSGGSTGK